MMDFIMVPLIVGIVFTAIYGLFELFVRRKERILIIEKLADKIKQNEAENQMFLPSYCGPRFSFSALKIGCLLIGIGLGLLVGLFLNIGLDLNSNGYQTVSAAYGASVLLFGGLGLIIAFLIELRINKKK